MKNYLLFILLFLMISAFGQWTDDPEENTEIFATSGDDILPKVASDEDGNTFIAFQSSQSGNYDVYLAYLDKDGHFLWDEPLLVSGHEQQSWVSDFSMALDDEGNAIVTFSDIRTGNPDIQAYKISPDGAFLWGDDGIACSQTPEPEYEPHLAVTDDNITFITFIHPGSTEPDELIVTAIDAEGTLLLGESGIAFTTGNEDERYSDPYVVAAGSDVILVYSITSGNFPAVDRILHAMKLDENGDEVWEEPALISDASGIAGFTDLNVRSDRQGGVMIGWHDDRNQDMISDAFFQHVDSQGNTLSDNGIQLASEAGFHRFDPIPVSDVEQENFFIYWRQANSNQSEFGLYGQRLSLTGEKLWGENGQEFLPIGNTFNMLADARLLNAGRSVVFYTKAGGASDVFLHAQAINQDAGAVWPQTSSQLSSYPSGISNVMATEKEQNQFVVAWQDGRDNQGIYAQNMHHDGNIGIIDNQVAINTSNNFSVFPNPAQTASTISTSKAGNIVISNSQGKTVFKEKVNQAESISFNPGAPGLYFVTFHDGFQTETRKLIIR